MNEPFELHVEDVFTISGRGPVCVGKISKGRVKVGDALVARTSGGEQAIVVTGITIGKKMVDEAVEGTDVGLLLRGFKPEQLKDAAGVPVMGGATRVELVLREGSDARAATSTASSIEASIAKMRGGEKPWWKFW